MKVLLVQLSGSFTTGSFTSGMARVPLAAAFLKAMAYKEGMLDDGSVSIEILNERLAKCRNEERLTREIVLRQPVVLGFSLYSWNMMSSIHTASKIKKKNPHIKIIVGGPEVFPDNIHIRSASYIDIMVTGEGERPFIDILKYFVYGQPKLNEIKGIFYRKNKKIQINPPQEPLKNLDLIPSPYLLGYIRPKDKFMWVVLGRGCPNRCKFCSEWMIYKGEILYFSKERIQKELQFARQKGVRQIKLEIPTFNASIRKMKEICQVLREVNEDNSMSFRVELRADYIDRETVRILKNANITYAELGLETVNPVALKNIGREINLNRFLKGVSFLKNEGIHCLVNLLLGLPGDTLETIKETFRFLISNRIDRMAICTFSILSIGPGTCLRSQADRYGIKYQKYPPYRVIKTNSISTRELKQAFFLSDLIFKKVRLKNKIITQVFTE